MDEHTAPEAAAALEEVQARQAQLMAVATVPVWYWWVIALPMVALGALVDTRRPGWIAAGAVCFGLGTAGLTVGTILRAQGRAQWRKETMDTRGPLLLLGFIFGVIGVGLGAAFALRAGGVGHPATIGCGLSALGLVVGGPLVMRAIQRVMLSNRVGLTP
ncbi:MAG TPA: hypothetical protein VN781_03640 [Acidimicrobiales bacterium]|nr:hypothetical protein [Acidimicrobiales bacterium]